MALPTMAGMAVHTTYLIADTAFIGTLGTDALAAATFVAPLFFLTMALTMGLGTAVTALVAQAIGRGDAEAADSAAGTAISTGCVLGVVFGVVGLVAGPTMLEIMGAEGRVAELGWDYFRVLALFMPLFFVSSVLRSILTGEGDAKIPMLVLTISTLANIGFDAFFIFVLDLGLSGAALATVMSVLISVTSFSVLLMRREKAFVQLRPSALVPKTDMMSQLGSLAIPIAASMIVMSLGTMLYNWLLSDFGTVAVAAYGAASKVDMIVVLPIFGLAGAAVTVVGMFAGAGRRDLVRSTALYTYRWAISLAAIIGGAAFMSSGFIVRIFTSDPRAIEIGASYLGYMIFAYPMMAIGMTTGRLLQGLGHGFPALMITTLRVLIIGVPSAFLAVRVMGQSIEGVWVGILSGGLAATVASLMMARRLIWRADPTRKATVGA